MKTLRKVIFGILLLAFVLGATSVCILADAGDTQGVNVLFSQDFEGGETAGIYYSYLDGGVSSEIEDAPGTEGYNTAMSEHISLTEQTSGENTYLTYTADGAAVGTNDNYLYLNFADSVDLGQIKTASGNLLGETCDTDYITIDFDIATETVFIKGLSLELLVGGYRIEAIEGSAEGDALQTGGKLQFVNRLDTVLCGDSTAAADLFYTGINAANEWAHITIVLDTTALSASDSVYNNAASAVGALYINGDYMSTFDNAFAQESASFDGLRFAIPGADSAVGQSLALDNVSVKAYDGDYTGNLGEVLDTFASITEFDDTAYTAEYEKPVVRPIAKIGEDSYYDVLTLGKAISEKFSGDTPSVDAVEILRDVWGHVVVTAEIAEEDVTVTNAGEYRLNLHFAPGAEYGIFSGDTATFGTTANDLKYGDTGFSAKSTVEFVHKVNGALGDAKTNMFKDVTVELYADLTFYSFYDGDCTYDQGSTKTLDSITFLGDNLVLNMNGHAITRIYSSAIKSHLFNTGGAGNLTVNDGTIDEQGIADSKYVLFFQNASATAVFNNVTFKNKAGLQARRGCITLNGCSSVSLSKAKFLCIESQNHAGLTVCINSSTISTSKKVLENYVNSTANPLQFHVRNSSLTTTGDYLAYTYDGKSVGTKAAPVYNFTNSTLTGSKELFLARTGCPTINIGRGCKVKATAIASESGGAASLILSINLADGVQISTIKLINSPKDGATNNTVLGNGASFIENNPEGVSPYTYIVTELPIQFYQNLTLGSSFDFNFYVPIDYEIVGVTADGEEQTIPADTVTLFGKEYKMIIITGIQASEAAENLEICVTYTCNSGYSGTIKGSVSVLSYADYIIQNKEQNIVYADAKQLMVDTLEYVRQAYKYVGKAADASMEGIEAALEGQTPTDYGRIEEDIESDCSLSSLSGAGYLLSAQVYLDSSPTFRFAFRSTGEAFDVTFIYNKNGETVTETVTVDAEGKHNGLGYYDVATCAFEFNTPVTVKIGNLEGTYSLYTYINAVSRSEAETYQNAATVAKALAVYCNTAKKYK